MMIVPMIWIVKFYMVKRRSLVIGVTYPISTEMFLFNSWVVFFIDMTETIYTVYLGYPNHYWKPWMSYDIGPVLYCRPSGPQGNQWFIVSEFFFLIF